MNRIVKKEDLILATVGLSKDRLSELILILAEAPRMGSVFDEPEGSRYISISDTLALELYQNLIEVKRLFDELIVTLDNLSQPLPEGVSIFEKTKVWRERRNRALKLLNKIKLIKRG